MASTISHAGYRQSASERRTLAGGLVFVALIALVLLAIAQPGLAGATALGSIGGHLLGLGVGR